MFLRGTQELDRIEPALFRTQVGLGHAAHGVAAALAMLEAIFGARVDLQSKPPSGRRPEPESYHTNPWNVEREVQRWCGVYGIAK